MKYIWQASCYETSFCEDQVRLQPCAMCRAFQGVTSCLGLYCHVSASFMAAAYTVTQDKPRVPDTSDMTAFSEAQLPQTVGCDLLDCITSAVQLLFAKFCQLDQAGSAM